MGDDAKTGAKRADPPPKRGRKPTKEEMENLVLVYPRLKDADVMITDEANGRYNCFSFAIFCNSISRWYEPDMVGREEAIKKSLTEHGWVKSDNCEHKKGFRKLAIYDDAPKGSANPFWLHAAKETAAGDGWESKDGDGHRFTHPSPGALLPPAGKETEPHWKFRYLWGCYEKPLDKVLEDLRKTVATIDDRLKNEPGNQSLKDARADALRDIYETEQQQAKDAK